ncbi:hypothetical protein F511_29547 [Dorcoceras hygrometricum]|uniref:Uncharacterized protein n=1 Tax=Dorcoceras hygrometricum TaxID=472368 RepID=A0A2Z7DGE4_9LAMI|nr:hypothetical protein F511_29547 [Dorcoceras hygrometricum]
MCVKAKTATYLCLSAKPKKNRPNVGRNYSYTSILRLGLAVGDTLDAPRKYLGTRGPSTAASTLPTSVEARATKKHSWSSGFSIEACNHLGNCPSTYIPEDRAPAIRGASPDTLSAPSDECFVVADVQAYSPVPDARRARGPRCGDSSQLNYLATSIGSVCGNR